MRPKHDGRVMLYPLEKHPRVRLHWPGGYRREQRALCSRAFRTNSESPSSTPNTTPWHASCQSALTTPKDCSCRNQRTWHAGCDSEEIVTNDICRTVGTRRNSGVGGLKESSTRSLIMGFTSRMELLARLGIGSSLQTPIDVTVIARRIELAKHVERLGVPIIN
jgi:hypothetical protein